MRVCALGVEPIGKKATHSTNTNLKGCSATVWWVSGEASAGVQGAIVMHGESAAAGNFAFGRQTVDQGQNWLFSEWAQCPSHIQSNNKVHLDVTYTNCDASLSLSVQNWPSGTIKLQPCSTTLEHANRRLTFPSICHHRTRLSSHPKRGQIPFVAKIKRSAKKLPSVNNCERVG